MKHYRWELSQIPEETKEDIIRRMRTYDPWEFSLYCDEAGWEDWMYEFTLVEDCEPIHECEAKVIEGIQRALWDAMITERNIRTYDGLLMDDRLNCLDGYINRLCPYDDFGMASLSAMEYEIRESLNTGGYYIDDSGNWYHIDGSRI